MATWRDHPQRSDVQIWVDAPATALAARVNQAAFAYPLQIVVMDTITTGVYTDVEVGMTVLFGSSAGADDLGRSYIALPAASNALFIGRSEQGDHDGEVNLADNAYITVLDDYRLWAKVPAISGGSGVRQTDGTRTFAVHGPLPPVIVLDCGTAVQADVDAGTGKVTFAFDASASYAAEPGAALVDFGYRLPGGAHVTAGATNTDAVTFTVSEGVYTMHLDVEDDNGTVQTRHVRLIAKNAGNLTGWTLSPWDIGDDGQTLALKLIAPLDKATYPDGTGLYAWHSERYGGAAGSLYGPSGSKHMLFCGWLDTEDASTQAGDKGVLSETTLRALDAAGRMKQLMTVPISTGNEDDADSWDEMVDANLDKLMVRALNEYSTVLSLCDFRWSGAGATYAFTRWDSSGGTLWDVVSGYGYAMGGGKYVLTCDEWGRLAVPVDPMLVDSGSRTATVQQALTEADWTAIRAGRDRAARYRFFWGKSTVPSTSNASETKTIPTAQAVAPGLSGGPGPTDTTVSGYLATSEENVTLVKHLYERLSAPDKEYVIDLAHGGPGGISPAAKQWITVTQSSANAAQRGGTLAATRMLPTKVRVSYDATHGLMSRTVTAERETVGVAAVAYVPKQRIEHHVPRDLTPPGYDIGGLTPVPTTPSNAALYAGTARIALICLNGLALTVNFGNGPGVLWNYYTWASLSIAGTVLLWVPNGYDPGSGWLITSTKTYYLVLGANTSVLKHTFGTASLKRAADASFGFASQFAASSYYDGVGTKCLHTADNSTFTEDNVDVHYATDGAASSLVPACYVSSRASGKIITSAHKTTTTKALISSTGRISTTGGGSGSWSELDSAFLCGFGLGQQIHVPWGTGNENTIFHGGIFAPEAGASSQRLYRFNGGSQVDISPVVSGNKFGPRAGRDQIATFVGNPNRMLAVLQSAVVGGGYATFLSDDALAATPSWSVLSAVPSIYSGGAIAGDSGATFYLWGDNQVVALSEDSGLTIVSQAGNLSSFATGPIISLAGY